MKYQKFKTDNKVYFKYLRKRIVGIKNQGGDYI